MKSEANQRIDRTEKSVESRTLNAASEPELSRIVIAVLCCACVSLIELGAGPAGPVILPAAPLITPHYPWSQDSQTTSILAQHKYTPLSLACVCPAM